MNLRLSLKMRLASVVVLALMLASCSKQEGADILGHWRADRVKFSSLNLALGPEILITKSDLHIVDSDVHIPIQSLSENGSEFVINTSAGLGLSFYLESFDRMYFEVPLVGRIYYQRLKDTR